MEANQGDQSVGEGSVVRRDKGDIFKSPTTLLSPSPPPPLILPIPSSSPNQAPLSPQSGCPLGKLTKMERPNITPPEDMAHLSSGVRVRIATFNVENLFARFQFKDNGIGGVGGIHETDDGNCGDGLTGGGGKSGIDTPGGILNSKSAGNGTTNGNNQAGGPCATTQICVDTLGFTRGDLIFDVHDSTEKKITAEIIKGIDADIIAIQEVESLSLLDRFCSKYLRTCGYKYSMLIDGHDPRGINVALLSKFPFKRIASFKDERESDCIARLSPRSAAAFKDALNNMGANVINNTPAGPISQNNANASVLALQSSAMVPSTPKFSLSPAHPPFLPPSAPPPPIVPIVPKSPPIISHPPQIPPLKKPSIHTNLRNGGMNDSSNGKDFEVRNISNNFTTTITIKPSENEPSRPTSSQQLPPSPTVPAEKEGEKLSPSGKNEGSPRSILEMLERAKSGQQPIQSSSPSPSPHQIIKAGGGGTADLERQGRAERISPKEAKSTKKAVKALGPEKPSPPRVKEPNHLGIVINDYKSLNDSGAMGDGSDEPLGNWDSEQKDIKQPDGPSKQKEFPNGHLAFMADGRSSMASPLSKHTPSTMVARKAEGIYGPDGERPIPLVLTPQQIVSPPRDSEWIPKKSDSPVPVGRHNNYLNMFPTPASKAVSATPSNPPQTSPKGAKPPPILKHSRSSSVNTGHQLKMSNDSPVLDLFELGGFGVFDDLDESEDASKDEGSVRKHRRRRSVHDPPNETWEPVTVSPETSPTSPVANVIDVLDLAAPQIQPQDQKKTKSSPKRRRSVNKSSSPSVTSPPIILPPPPPVMPRRFIPATFDIDIESQAEELKELVKHHDRELAMGAQVGNGRLKPRSKNRRRRLSLPAGTSFGSILPTASPSPTPSPLPLDSSPVKKPQHARTESNGTETIPLYIQAEQLLRQAHADARLQLEQSSNAVRRENSVGRKSPGETKKELFELEGELEKRFSDARGNNRRHSLSPRFDSSAKPFMEPNSIPPGSATELNSPVSPVPRPFGRISRSKSPQRGAPSPPKPIEPSSPTSQVKNERLCEHIYLFSRDCLVVEVDVHGIPIYIYVNHFKSMAKGRAATAAKRSLQTARVRLLLQNRFIDSRYCANIVVCGDFNDFPDETTSLFPLLGDPHMEDLLTRLPRDERWTHHFSAEESYQQLDYMMVSKPLARLNRDSIPTVIRNGLPHRAVAYNGARLVGVGDNRPKASDHCAVFADLLLLSASAEQQALTAIATAERRVQNSLKQGELPNQLDILAASQVHFFVPGSSLDAGASTLKKFKAATQEIRKNSIAVVESAKVTAQAILSASQSGGGKKSVRRRGALAAASFASALEIVNPSCVSPSLKVVSKSPKATANPEYDEWQQLLLEELLWETNNDLDDKDFDPASKPRVCKLSQHIEVEQPFEDEDEDDEDGDYHDSDDMSFKEWVSQGVRLCFYPFRKVKSLLFSFFKTRRERLIKRLKPALLSNTADDHKQYHSLQHSWLIQSWARHMARCAIGSGTELGTEIESSGQGGLLSHICSGALLIDPRGDTAGDGTRAFLSKDELDLHRNQTMEFIWYGFGIGWKGVATRPLWVYLLIEEYLQMLTVCKPGKKGSGKHVTMNPNLTNTLTIPTTKNLSNPDPFQGSVCSNDSKRGNDVINTITLQIPEISPSPTPSSSPPLAVVKKDNVPPLSVSPPVRRTTNESGSSQSGSSFLSSLFD